MGKKEGHMGITLSAWVTRLQDDVPARNGVPTSTQYPQAIKDAVIDFNNRATRQKVITLQITSGQASYSLPTDFWKYVRLTWRTAKEVIISPQGLIPLTPFRPWDKHTIDISALTITFYPTPQYTFPRDLWYGAGHVLSGTTGSETYAEMSQQEYDIAHLLAQYHALMKQANKATQDAWQYQLGQESVNKTSLADKIREQARELKTQYDDEVKKWVGSQGTVARYEIY
jgi:hypothetical protein